MPDASMDSLLAYGIIRALHEEDQSSYGIFAPFVLAVLSGEPQTVNAIRTALARIHKFEPPNHVLTTILSSLKKKGQVSQKGARYFLSQGTDTDSLGDRIEETRRGVNKLADDGCQFLQQRGFNVDRQGFLGELEAILRSHLAHVISALAPGSIPGDIQVGDFTPVRRQILNYLMAIEDANPELHATASALLSGSLLSLPIRMDLLGVKSPSANTKPRVFVDTNFLLPLLGLQAPEKQEAAKDLLRLLQLGDYSLEVLDITIDELCRLISNYPGASHKYVAQIEVDHIFYFLKQRKWTRSDVEEFIQSIESEIRKLGIEPTLSNINLKRYKPNQPDLWDRIDRHRYYQSDLTKAHDLAAIEYVQGIRKSKVRAFTDASAFFLTSDYGVAKFCLKEHGHNDAGTVPEAILDITLASILWIQAPSDDIPLHALAAAHAQGTFISPKIWDRFYSSLENLVTNGDIPIHKIRCLFYRNFAKEHLLSQQDSPTPDVEEGTLKEWIEEVSQEIEKEKEDAVDREMVHAQERIDELVQEETKAARAEESAKFATMVQERRRQAREKAQAFALKQVRTLRIGAAGALLLAGLGLWAVGGFSLILDASTLVGGVGVVAAIGVGSIDRLWSRLEMRLQKRIYTTFFEDLI